MGISPTDKGTDGATTPETTKPEIQAVDTAADNTKRARRPRRSLGYVLAFPLVVAISAGFVQLLVEYGVVQPIFSPGPGPGPPGDNSRTLKPRPWKTQNTPTDLGGAHAEGTIWRTPDGRVHMTGTIKDTEPDSMGPLLKIEVHHADGRIQHEDDYNTEGAQRVVDIGGGESGYVFGPNIRMILITECLLARNAKEQLYQHVCGSAPAVIWQS